MKTLEVIIGTDGSVTIEGKGFAGPECAKATKELSDALGVVTGERKTADWYKAQAQQVKAR